MGDRALNLPPPPVLVPMVQEAPAASQPATSRPPTSQPAEPRPERTLGHDVPAARADGIQVIEGSVRRSGTTTLPQAGPSGLRSGQIATSAAQQTPITDIYDRDGLHVRWYLQSGLNYDIENNLFWNLASVFSPQSRFNSDEYWLEGYANRASGSTRPLPMAQYSMARFPPLPRVPGGPMRSIHAIRARSRWRKAIWGSAPGGRGRSSTCRSARAN